MESLDERKGLSRRNLLAGIGLGAAGAFLAAACGGTAAPAMEEQAEEAEAPKAEEEMKQAEEATPVQFLHWWIPALTRMVLRPGPWKSLQIAPGIPVEDVGRDPIEPVRQHFRTTIAAGTPVDVSFNSIIWARDHWDLGILMDYTPYLTQYPELQDDKFFEASHQFRQAEGATFGIPVMGPESTSIVVNGQLLLDAGLDENGGDINNWSGLVEAARAMTKKEGNDVSVSGFLLPNGVGGLSRWQAGCLPQAPALTMLSNSRRSTTLSKRGIRCSSSLISGIKRKSAPRIPKAARARPLQAAASQSSRHAPRH